MLTKILIMTVTLHWRNAYFIYRSKIICYKII